jgi:outer membrane receptor protein involved in Fe transport
MWRKLTQIGAMLLILPVVILGQTTGKLSGRVLDENGEPVIAANVVLLGTTTGAATDLEGNYVVLNVRASTYSVRFSAIGYQTKTFEDVRIIADQTVRLDLELGTQMLEADEVVVTAERPLVEFNQTSSVTTITHEDIQRLPVQELNEIVNLQAGVVDGHFRGGRIGEVQFQVDGVTVNNPYDNSATLELDRSVLEQVQVISGTFDAKYGQAMSGVVNAILKSGSDRFEWSGEVYGGDYYTRDETRYPNNQSFSPAGIQNYQFTLSGPAFLPGTTFFASARRFSSDGWLFGQRIFYPTDSSNFETGVVRPTGDGKTVRMEFRENWSGQAKLTNRSFGNIHLSYQAIVNDIKTREYEHNFRLNPEGLTTRKTLSVTHGLDWTHSLSTSMFYKLSVRQNYFDYSDYSFEDLFDPRYLEAGQPRSDANFAFGAVVQGVQLGRFIQQTTSEIVKADFTWQANPSNMIEAGVEGQVSRLKFGSPGFLRATFDPATGLQTLRAVADSDDPRDPRVESYSPRQVAAYLQDRLEWRDLVVRAGVRLEYFDANATTPSDLKNPANSIEGAPESESNATSAKSAVAPRLGISFPLSANASVYFSYGHFYQMPGLGKIFDNANYAVLRELQDGGVSYSVLGNPDLKPEFTVQYEFGIKQALTDYLGLEATFFYKDIRDLLGVEFVQTYAAADYARFTNVDYGSVYGFTIALDQRAVGSVAATLDYTLQYARGNSSDPAETANRAETGKDPRPRDIPFTWDQRHTLNATAILSKPENYSISTIMKFGSGQPFTPEVGTGFVADQETNSARKGSFVIVDLRAEKFLNIGPVRSSVFFRVFNLLNTSFANGFVFADTGSPDYSRFPEVNQAQLINPERYREPRRIEFGLTFRSR